MHILRKRHSYEKMDSRALEFIQNNNCTLHKNQRKKVAKMIYNVSRNDSTNLTCLPAYSRFIAIINQYFPEIGTEILVLLHNEFLEL
jgi:regulator of nonsense transcripts 2